MGQWVVIVKESIKETIRPLGITKEKGNYSFQLCSPRDFLGPTKGGTNCFGPKDETAPNRSSGQALSHYIVTHRKFELIRANSGNEMIKLGSKVKAAMTMVAASSPSKVRGDFRWCRFVMFFIFSLLMVSFVLLDLFCNICQVFSILQYVKGWCMQCILRSGIREERRRGG